MAPGARVPQTFPKAQPATLGGVKKVCFFNAPAKSADGNPPILRENCVFCISTVRFFAEKRAKTSRSRGEQLLDGSLKNREASFLTASYGLRTLTISIRERSILVTINKFLSDTSSGRFASTFPSPLARCRCPCSSKRGRLRPRQSSGAAVGSLIEKKSCFISPISSVEQNSPVFHFKKLFQTSYGSGRETMPSRSLSNAPAGMPSVRRKAIVRLTPVL